MKLVEDSGPQAKARLWDARAQHDVGVLLARYLRENPPPEETRTSRGLAKSAEDFLDVGARGLRTLGASPIRPVPKQGGT